MDELAILDGIANVTSDVSEARDEIVVDVDPANAAAIGLSAQQVAFQVNQFFVERNVATVQTDDGALDVALSMDSTGIQGPESLDGLVISGPLGSTTLGRIAEIRSQPGAGHHHKDGRLPFGEHYGEHHFR